MKKISVVVLVSIALAVFSSFSPVPETEMNVCGISLNQSRETFMKSYNKTLLDALYYTEVKESDEDIVEEVVCEAEFSCKEDACRIFTSTAYYLQLTQEGLVWIDVDIPNHGVMKVGNYGTVIIDRDKRRVSVVFKKN